MAEIENLKIDGGSTYTVGNQDIVANEWEASKTYVKGKSYVIREHRLYVCNVTHTSVEPFDPDNWTEITVGDAIAANTTAIGSLSALTTTDKSSLVGAVNEVNTNKSNTLLVERKTAQLTMDNYYKSATISLTKTGYTAIGIVGYQTNTVGVVCFRNNIEGTNAIVGLVNRDGTTALGTNVDLYIDILYLKN